VKAWASFKILWTKFESKIGKILFNKAFGLKKDEYAMRKCEDRSVNSLG
jgi:hypothetical protein